MSRINISAIGYDATETAAWEAYVGAHTDATIYHTLAWRSIFEQSFGYRSWLLMARDADDGRVVGVLPLYRVANPFASRLVSVPFRDRGGPLWSNPEALDALIVRAKELLVSTNATYLHLKSLRPWSEEEVRRNALTETMHWVHSVVSLEGVDSQGLWKRLADKRRNIRRAESHGLVFEDMTASDRALNDWYDLHLTTQKRLGVPPFPRQFFSNMARELRKIDALRLYFVRSGNTALSAMVILRHRHTWVYGYSASTGDAERVRSNDLMLYKGMCALINEGYLYFDMGSDAPSQETLLRFKRKWGAWQQQIPTYTFGAPNAALTDSSSPSYAVARALLGRVPTLLAEQLGNRFTRYFG